MARACLTVKCNGGSCTSASVTWRLSFAFFGDLARALAIESSALLHAATRIRKFIWGSGCDILIRPILPLGRFGKVRAGFESVFGE